jgi:hypothetical protein
MHVLLKRSNLSKIEQDVLYLSHVKVSEVHKALVCRMVNLQPNRNNITEGFSLFVTYFLLLVLCSGPLRLDLFCLR